VGGGGIVAFGSSAASLPSFFLDFSPGWEGLLADRRVWGATDYITTRQESVRGKRGPQSLLTENLNWGI